MFSNYKNTYIPLTPSEIALRPYVYALSNTLLTESSHSSGNQSISGLFIKEELSISPVT